MAFQLGTTRYLLRKQAPVTRLAQPMPKSPVLWPTVSIVLLTCLTSIMTPLVLTVLNGALVLIAVALALLTNYAIDRRLVKLIVVFAVIVLCGLATGIGAPRYEYLKDAWYVINPVLVLLTGYVLYVAKPDLQRGLRAFVIGGLIVAVWQVRRYFVEPEIIFLPAGTIRSLVGTGFYAPVLALMIFAVFFGRWSQGLKLPPWLAVPIVLVTAVSVAAMFSRTALLVVLIAVAAAVGCFSKREWLRLGLPLALLIFGMFFSQLWVDVESKRALQTFGGKLARSVQELTISDYSDTRDVNLSYRGHETKQAMNQFAAQPLPQMLFGQGFAATVDLGFALPLAGGPNARQYIRYVGSLHNGYAFLLTKVGLVGMLLFVYFLAWLYMVGRPLSALPGGDERARVGRLFQGAIVTLAATTYVVGGVINKADMFPFVLLTGFLLAHFRRLEDELPVPARPSGLPLVTGKTR